MHFFQCKLNAIIIDFSIIQNTAKKKIYADWYRKRYAELEKWFYKWLEDQGCAGDHCMSPANLIMDLTS